MFTQWIYFSVVLYIWLTMWELCTGQGSLESKTEFIFYDKNNQPRYVSTSRYDNLSMEVTGCDPFDRYAILVHGLNESCDVNYAVELRQKLIKYRGGCIICMDYSQYSQSYPFLLLNFKEIADILTAKLVELRDNYFSSCTAYLFGFSTGSRIIAQAGSDFGHQLIERIHLCDLAGPGFDNITSADPKSAAMESQCIHTNAGGLGTLERKCHQDWLMGDCGQSQIAARPPPNGSHWLCTQFYISAFENDFLAVDKNETCNQLADSRDATTWPRGYRMGYFQKTNESDPNLDQRNFYAKTTRDPPYTAN